MIKVICGVVGHYVGGRVIPKDNTSEPFALDPALEAQLVAAGRAEYVGGTVTPPQAPAAPVGDAEPAGAAPDLPDGVTGIPEYSTADKVERLREIGKLCGLTFKVGMSKADMVAALDLHIAENMAEDEDIPEVDADADGVADDAEDQPDLDAADMVVQ